MGWEGVGRSSGKWENGNEISSWKLECERFLRLGEIGSSKSHRHRRTALLNVRRSRRVLLCRRHQRVVALCSDDHCPSVCLSVCPVADPKSRTEGRGKLKIDRKEARYMIDPWPLLEVKRSKSRSPGSLMPWPKISHIFGTGRPTSFRLGIQMEYDDPSPRHARWPQRSKVRGQCYNVTSSISRTFAHNTTKNSCRSTKIGWKLVRAVVDSAHQFEGQKVKVQGHQTDKWSGRLFRSPLAGGGGIFVAVYRTACFANYSVACCERVTVAY